jgi:hypothetical protein
MGNFYIDPVSGDDSNDGLGPYKAAFTSGGTTEIAVGDTVTGATSGKTAKVVFVVHGSGTWAGGDEAGTLYVGTPSGAFTNGENLDVSGKQNDIATLTADFVVSSWKTITLGATAARIAPSDNIRIKKNTDPESLGVNATFTNDSATVTLSSALTQLVCDCATNWEPSANVTRSTVSTLAMAGNCQQFLFASGFSTGKVAYFDFGEGNELNLSSYQAVTFGFYSSADIAAGMFTLKLCSDATGDTAVDEFVINKAIGYDVSIATLHRIFLNKGSALGSSIRSIALYANSDPGTITVRIDDINATNGLAHKSLIGKNDDWWMSIKSINGTDITLHDKYYGATETVPCYAINNFIDFEAASYSTAVNTITDSGSSSAALITYQGGWNFATNEQDGYTNFHLLANIGYGIYATGKNYIRLENFRVHGGYYSINIALNSAMHELKNIGVYNSNSGGINFDTDYASVKSVEGVINAFGINNAITLAPSTDTELLIPANIYCMSCGGSTFQYSLKLMAPLGGIAKLTGDVKFLCSSTAIQLIISCTSAYIKSLYSNGNYSFGTAKVGDIYIENLYLLSNIDSLFYNQANIGFIRICNIVLNGFTLNSTILSSNNFVVGKIAIDAIDSDATKFLGAVNGGYYGDHVTMGQAAGWAYGGSGTSLVLNPLFTTRTMTYPVYIPVAASKTYKVTFQKIKSSSGANCTMTIDVDGCGITAIADESVTLTDSWAKHESANITTTRAGFIRVIFKPLDGTSTGDIGLDEIKVEEQA